MAEAPAAAVHACSVADPFVVLLMEDGTVELLTLEVGGAEEKVGGAEEEGGAQEMGGAEKEGGAEEEGRARLVRSTPQLGEVRRNGASDCPCFFSCLPCVSHLLSLSSFRCPSWCVCRRL